MALLLVRARHVPNHCRLDTQLCITAQKLHGLLGVATLLQELGKGQLDLRIPVPTACLLEEGKSSRQLLGLDQCGGPDDVTVCILQPTQLPFYLLSLAHVNGQSGLVPGHRGLLSVGELMLHGVTTCGLQPLLGLEDVRRPHQRRHIVAGHRRNPSIFSSFLEDMLIQSHGVLSLALPLGKVALLYLKHCKLLLNFLLACSLTAHRLPAQRNGSIDLLLGGGKIADSKLLAGGVVEQLKGVLLDVQLSKGGSKQVICSKSGTVGGQEVGITLRGLGRLFVVAERLVDLGGCAIFFQPVTHLGLEFVES
eukprot:Colp12_sorted_trinity150504_noHs@13917